TQTRDHTERMLRYFFVRTTRDENGTVSIFGDQVPESRDFRIPGDLSSATYWLTAAAAQPGGHLLVRELGLNTTRTPVLGVLVRMGAQVREAIEDVDQLEPRGIVEITGAMLKGTVIQGKEVAQLIDELPVLAVAGALASGTTIIRQAQELRVKETDRIAAIAHNLRVMGAQVLELSDGLEIHGPAPLRGGRVASFGDHRIAMAFAVANAIEQSRIVCDLIDNQSRILIDDHDPTPHLRDDDVNRAVSLVSGVPRVREILVARMREYAKKDNLVMEGRDIGSVVFRDTPFKFYIDASPEVRVQRRLAEGQRDEIVARDRADS